MWMALAWPMAAAAASASVHLEDLTSTELSQRIAAGSTTVLVPIGGTEQNGAHMVLGKHNVRVRALAARIAGRLGDALVAPVLAYVPEGTIDPPTLHMRWAGTISIPATTFEAILEATARSLKQHGIRHVVFLGDHGGTQRSQERVAARLNREWSAQPSYRVTALRDYYRAAAVDFTVLLQSQGFGADEIGQHAGLADTALALAIDPALVRADRMLEAPRPGDGVAGDPRRASAELGGLGVERVVDASVAAIRAQASAGRKTGGVSTVR
jgi:creatinine amidohydrolase/Fe(II)-dependent formamide hydrolase-like protein